jgi:glycosyltransferase involved in cell wall biosynthesis
MNILLITNLFPPNVVGGAEILMNNLVEELRRKHDVSVLTSEGQCRFPNYVMPHLKLWAKYGDLSNISRTRYVYVAAYNRRMTKKAIRSVNPDIILVSQPHFLSYSPLITALKMKPTAVFLHDVYSLPLTCRLKGWKSIIQKPYSYLRGVPERLTLPYVLSNSYSTIDLQSKNITVKAFQKVGVGIPLPLNGGDHACSRLGNESQPGRFKLGFIGRISREKGIQDAIKALDILVNKKRVDGIRLEIAGLVADPGFKGELQAFIEKCSLHDNVELIGTVSEDDKYSFLRSCDVFLFTSQWKEGHGMTYLEAMAVGTPCICTANGGASEVLIHEENAVLYERGNIEQLVDAILRVKEDDKFRRRLATTARQMVRDRFSIEAFAMRVEASLERILQGQLS